MKKIFVFLFLAGGLLQHASAQTLLQEDFSTETLPPGWSNDSLGNPALYLWQFDNPGNRLILGSGFDTSFVILDSDHYGVFAQQLASLTTASFSAAGFTALSLELDEQYYTQQATGSMRKIEASGDGGASWFTVEADSVSTGYPIASHRIFPIDTLAGSTTIQIRFTYAGTWDYWWAIDNVKVVATTDCIVPPEAGQAVSSHAEVC